MATNDRFDAGERTDGVRSRSASLPWLRESVFWSAVGVIGMVLVFIGLGVDAWIHENRPGEETLLSFNNPGHAIAGIGLVVASIGLLGAFSLSMLKGVDSASNAIKRFVPVTAAWVAVAAIGIASITYIGATGATVGHSHDDGVAAVADDHHTDTSGGDAGVAAALEERGIGTSSESANVAGALTQGSNGEAGGHHDHGKHATYTEMMEMDDAQLVSLFPEGTVDASNIDGLRDQIAQVREVALKYPTEEAANAAGYTNTTSDVPFMGKHFLNFDYVRDGVFDPSKPEGLLFSKIDDGPPKLVGVWFLLIPGIGGVTRDTEPAGFVGDLDLWHAHVGLCLVGLSGASEGETKESCDAKGGRFTADLRWMMHVWVAPEVTENADGFFAYLNNDLYEKQAAMKSEAQAPSGNTP